MTNVSLYIRVSTLEQSMKGFSIEGQELALRNYCKKVGKNVVRVYIDAGVSGGSTKNRGQLQQMLKDSDQGLFSELVVWKLNRLGRNLKDLLNIVNLLQDNFVSLTSITESLDTRSAVGIFTLQTLGAISEYERSNTKENSKLGQERKNIQGWFNAGVVYGYDFITKETVIKSKLKTNLRVNESEAAIIQRIFSMYNSGLGYKAISNRLNSEGLNTKFGKRFHVNSIRQILRNVVYVGKINAIINGKRCIVEGLHEPVISNDEYEKAQKRMKSRYRPNKHFGKYQFLLSGLIKCPKCGSGMVAYTSKQKRKDGTMYKRDYYICGKYHNGGISCCNANSVPAIEAEKVVLNEIEALIKKPIIMDKVYKQLNVTPNEIKELIKSLKRKKKLKEKAIDQLNKILTSYEKSKITLEEFKVASKEISNQIVEMEQKIQSQEKKISNEEKTRVSKSHFNMVLTSIERVLQKANPEDLKKLYRSIIEKVLVNHEKRVSTVVLKIDENAVMLKR